MTKKLIATAFFAVGSLALADIALPPKSAKIELTGKDAIELYDALDVTGKRKGVGVEERIWTSTEKTARITCTLEKSRRETTGICTIEKSLDGKPLN